MPSPALIITPDLCVLLQPLWKNLPRAALGRAGVPREGYICL